MGILQKISVLFTNATGGLSHAAPVAIVNKGGHKTALSITRPANILAYTAGDVVGVADAVTPANPGSGVLEFVATGTFEGSIRINSVDLRVDLSAVPVGMGAFVLHLYDAAPDAVLDNAAWTLSSAGDRAKYLGSVSLGSPAVAGATLFSQVEGVNKQVQIKEGVTSLFGVLVTAGGYIPAAGTVYAVRLHATEL